VKKRKLKLTVPFVIGWGSEEAPARPPPLRSRSQGATGDPTLCARRGQAHTISDHEVVAPVV
jgi:hypothetical protein